MFTSVCNCKCPPVASIEDLFIFVFDPDPIFHLHVPIFFLWPVLVSFSLLVLHKPCYHYDQAHILINHQLPESRVHVRLGCLNCEDLLVNPIKPNLMDSNILYSSLVNLTGTGESCWRILQSMVCWVLLASLCRILRLLPG